MVNLVTKRPTGSDFGNLDLRLGSNDYREVNADLNQVLNEEGNIYGRLGLTYREGTNETDYVDGRIESLLHHPSLSS